MTVAANTSGNPTPAISMTTSVTGLTVQIPYREVDNGGQYSVPGGVLNVKVNAAPTANNVTSSPAIPSTAGATAISPMSGTDTDGTIASYTIRSLPTAAQGILYVNGVAATVNQVVSPANNALLTFDPAGIYGNFTFTYQVTDNDGLISANTATYTIPVGNVGPTAVVDQNDVPLNTATTGNVLLNDTDPELGALTTTVTVQPAHGTVTLASNGSYTYTPANNYLGPDTFIYQACDNGSPALCDTALVRIRVYNPATACVSGTGANLLTNAGFQSGNTGFVTTLTYVGPGGNMYPEDTYTVTADVSPFHSAFSGHGASGAASDKFLAVNASPTIKTMYLKSVTVQPNRYYTFSAYFTNLLTAFNLADPQVGFVINGQSTSGIVNIVERSPQPSTTAQWIKFSDVWYSGANTTAVFEIRNLTIDRSGNDLGIDSVYFGTCNLPPVANVDLRNTPPATPFTFNITANDVDGGRQHRAEQRSF